MGQSYRFHFSDHLLAGLAGVRPYDLHTDVEAMIAGADAVAPLAERLGVDPPPPHLAGLGYVHVTTLGAELRFGPELMEPAVLPCIRTPEDIDGLAEPEDYLSAGVVPQRLALADELKRRRADASDSIGHDYQGPVTSCVLLMGQQFFLLPYDDPSRAHRLLAFCTQSAIRYTRVLRQRQGRTATGHVGLCDDFAGMFPPDIFREFVAPYWNMLFEGLDATHRTLHSELLREGHLPALEDLRIDSFDPSVDPHLPAEVLARSCRVPYGLRIWPSRVIELSADELVALYRHYAGFHTQYVTFGMGRVSEERKVAALLAVARDLEANHE